MALELVRVGGMAEGLVGMLRMPVDAQMASEVAWLMVYIAANSDDAVDLMLTAGAAPPLVALMNACDDVALLTPVIRTLGNITSIGTGGEGSDTGTDAVLAGGEEIGPGGTITLLVRCLLSPHRTLHKEVCWVMANVAGGRWEHKQAVMALAGAELVDAMVKGPFEVRKEAAFALGEGGGERGKRDRRRAVTRPLLWHGMVIVGNICGPLDVVALEYVVGGGCIPPLLALLRCPDVEAVRMALQFVEMVMRGLPGKRGVAVVEEWEGVEALEGLQFHNNDELRRMANHVIDTYFGMEEEDG